MNFTWIGTLILLSGLQLYTVAAVLTNTARLDGMITDNPGKYQGSENAVKERHRRQLFGGDGGMLGLLMLLSRLKNWAPPAPAAAGAKPAAGAPPAAGTAPAAGGAAGAPPPPPGSAPSGSNLNTLLTLLALTSGDDADHRATAY